MLNTLELKNRYLRHVHWAISSPSLMAKPSLVNYIQDGEHERSIVELLFSLDQSPAEVNEHFQSLRHMPMGKYFEQLVFFMLERDDRYEIILQNHQIQEGKITVGEIDLVVKDVLTDQLEHWEIALKFYLQSRLSSEQNIMLGPNAKDNLARKIKKLTQHQMKLSLHGQIQYLFEDQTIDRKLFIKGYFFYKFNTKNIVPVHSHPNHSSGEWCFNSEVESVLDNSLKWIITHKPDWIGPHQLSDNSDVHSSSKMMQILQEHFEHGTQSVLCVGLKCAEKRCIEVSRCFVVNDLWPNGSIKS